ncbi:hypothetical protein BC827DRAFT_424673 [Russula dissimulans]|nr:hypothetical protein BC827DRAFT_424673 [Russula dissimulans]
MCQGVLVPCVCLVPVTTTLFPWTTFRCRERLVAYLHVEFPRLSSLHARYPRGWCVTPSRCLDVLHVSCSGACSSLDGKLWTVYGMPRTAVEIRPHGHLAASTTKVWGEGC